MKLPENLHQLAKNYRVEFKIKNPKPGFGYFVLNEDGWKICGWTENLPEPKNYEPGVVFVSVESGEIFKTVCGNAQSGATDFVKL